MYATPEAAKLAMILNSRPHNPTPWMDGLQGTSVRRVLDGSITLSRANLSQLEALAEVHAEAFAGKSVHVLDGTTLVTYQLKELVLNALPSGLFSVLNVHASAPVLSAAPRAGVLSTPATVRGLADMLQAIRAAFGLNVSQMADVLHVKRMTIYTWLKENAMDTLHQGNRDRLLALYDIATRWSGNMPLSGPYLHERLPMGASLFDLLTASRLDHDAILGTYEILVKTKGANDRFRQHLQQQNTAARKGLPKLAAAFKNLEQLQKKSRGEPV